MYLPREFFCYCFSACTNLVPQSTDLGRTQGRKKKAQIPRGSFSLWFLLRTPRVRKESVPDVKDKWSMPTFPG